MSMDVSMSLIIHPSDDLNVGMTINFECKLQVYTWLWVWVWLSVSMNVSVSLNISLTQSTGIKISEYNHRCEYLFDCVSEWRYEYKYDYEFWGLNTSEYTIESLHMTVSEYECESELECKSK